MVESFQYQTLHYLINRLFLTMFCIAATVKSVFLRLLCSLHNKRQQSMNLIRIFYAYHFNLSNQKMICWHHGKFTLSQRWHWTLKMVKKSSICTNIFKTNMGEYFASKNTPVVNFNKYKIKFEWQIWWGRYDMWRG